MLKSVIKYINISYFFLICININGNMYINSVSNLKRYKDFVNEQTIPYIINNKKELIDIDTMEDFNKGKKLF